MPSGRSICNNLIRRLKNIESKHNHYIENNPFTRPQYLYNFQIAIWEVDTLIEALEDKLKDWRENGEPQQNEHIRTLKDERPKGKWTPGEPKCPCCGEDKFKDLDADIWADWQPKFCPNCGADMREENDGN